MRTFFVSCAGLLATALVIASMQSCESEINGDNSTPTQKKEEPIRYRVDYIAIGDGSHSHIECDSARMVDEKTIIIFDHTVTMKIIATGISINNK